MKNIILSHLGARVGVQIDELNVVNIWCWDEDGKEESEMYLEVTQARALLSTLQTVLVLFDERTAQNG